MKKTFIIMFVMAIIAMAATGKTLRRKLSIYRTNVPETETLAIGTMEFVYDYKWCVDTTGQLDNIDNSYERDQMLLQIASNGLSKFSSSRI